MKTFIIAEAGVNHNGDEKLALQLVEIAAACGADAVKFQTFNADKLVRKGAEKAEYQKRETSAGDQYSMLKTLEISESLHRKLFERCNELSIEFMSTPFDEDAADFLLALGMRRIKIPSGEITNHPFLRFLAAKNVPLILSTGMATLLEINEAIEVINQERLKHDFKKELAEVLTILHCTSNYPAEIKDVNLRALNTIAQSTRLPVGYSDHTLGTLVSTAAVAMGAQIIEKHFSLNRNLPGPDHEASLEPQELKQLIKNIRDVELAKGLSAKEPCLSELPIKDLVRRSVTAAKNISAGSRITSSDITLLRPGTGIQPRDIEQVIGKVAKYDILAGTTLTWDDI